MFIFGMEINDLENDSSRRLFVRLPINLYSNLLNFSDESLNLKNVLRYQPGNRKIIK